MRKIFFVCIPVIFFFSFCNTKRSINGVKIRNKEAYDLLIQEQKLDLYLLEYKFENLNQADSLEPNNPYILKTRGHLKFNHTKDFNGAIKDLSRTLKLLKHKNDIEQIYYTLGQWYTELGMVKSSYSAFSYAGEASLPYLEKYSGLLEDTLLNSNSDKKLKIEFKLLKKEIRISSPHSPLQLSNYDGEIIIANIDHAPIEILNSHLAYGAKGSSSTIYLEASKLNGKKVIFFNDGVTKLIGCLPNTILSKGQSFKRVKSLEFRNKFCCPGIYKVRIALRPSNKIKGLEKTYYSNWDTLTVIRD